MLEYSVASRSLPRPLRRPPVLGAIPIGLFRRAPGALRMSLTPSRVGKEGPQYCGALPEFEFPHRRWYMYLGPRYCCPVVRALAFRDYA